ncbi:hypothetical protein U0D24_21615 [Hafnia paralvei]|uniref:hypothetical protein n=1 Tax=Hafnia paralvei TaxID=546367 RepID=UPI002FDBA31D
MKTIKTVVETVHKYAKLDIGALSTERLFELNSLIMQELQQRFSQPVIVKQPEIQQVVFAPYDAEVTLVNNCLRIARSGEYVKAEMKDRYRDIVLKYPDWAKSLGYPPDLRGSDFRDWNIYLTKKDE